MPTPAFTTPIYVVRAALVNGSVTELLSFFARRDADDYAAELRSARLTGFDSFDVVERSVIGAPGMQS